MKVLLVGEKLAHRSFNGANKALPVLAHCLDAAGFPDVLQLDLERPDVGIDRVVGEAADAELICFVGCMTPQWPELDQNVRRVADSLVARSRRHVPIVVGGYATKSVADIAVASPWISGFFDGEGEAGIVEIAEAVARGSFMQERARIRGLCYVDEQGTYRTSIAARVEKFDEIDQHFGFVHVPERHDMDIFSADGRQLKTGQLFTQRGCPWQCGFCNKSLESNSVAWLSEESLRWQLRRLKAEGYEAVYLDVDTFTVHKERAIRQADILHEEGFVWGSNTRIDRIDLAMMKLFASRGCVYMFCGVEHLHEGVTVAIDKFNGSFAQQRARAAAYPQQVKDVYRCMTSAGLPSSFFVILGLPKATFDRTGTILTAYEPTTYEDDIEAVRFGIEECEPDFINFNLLRFMPGSVAADSPSHPAYSCVRPSNGRPITGGYFLPRVAAVNNYPLPDYHGVFRICESVGANQPRTTAVTADRIYDTVVYCMNLIAAQIERGGKHTRMFIDTRILQERLVWQNDDGTYGIAPLKEFEQLT